MSDKKVIRPVVICGARCIYKKDGRCNKTMNIVTATIGIDGQCVNFETTEK